MEWRSSASLRPTPSDRSQSALASRICEGSNATTEKGLLSMTANVKVQSAPKAIGWNAPLGLTRSGRVGPAPSIESIEVPRGAGRTTR